MAAPAVVGQERRVYVLELPVHRFAEDFNTALDASTPQTPAAALDLIGRWYSECAVALQQLAAVAAVHHLEIRFDPVHDDVLVEGPVLVLDGLEFLRAREDEDTV